MWDDTVSKNSIPVGSENGLQLVIIDGDELTHKPLFVINFGWLWFTDDSPATNTNELLRQFVEVRGEEKAGV